MSAFAYAIGRAGPPGTTPAPRPPQCPRYGRLPVMPDPGALPPYAADEAAGRRRAFSTTGAAGQRAAAPVPADPWAGHLLKRYQHAQVIMVAPLAGGVALVAVLNAARLGSWAALAVSLAVAIAALICLRARRWTQTIIRHLQNPPAPEICLGQVCARPSSLDPARTGQHYLDLLALTPSLGSRHPGRGPGPADSRAAPACGLAARRPGHRCSAGRGPAGSSSPSPPGPSDRPPAGPLLARPPLRPHHHKAIVLPGRGRVMSKPSDARYAREGSSPGTPRRSDRSAPGSLRVDRTQLRACPGTTRSLDLWVLHTQAGEFTVVSRRYPHPGSRGPAGGPGSRCSGDRGDHRCGPGGGQSTAAGRAVHGPAGARCPRAGLQHGHGAAVARQVRRARHSRDLR